MVEQVGKDLAGMLFIGQSVDGRDPAKVRKLLDVTLCKRADHRAVKHPPHNPRRVLNRFAAPQLDVVSREKHDIAAQFSDTDFETEIRVRVEDFENMSAQHLSRRGREWCARSAFIFPAREMMRSISARLRDSIERRCFME